MSQIHVGSLPVGFHWDREPAGWSLEDDALTIEAGPRTDLFVDPQGSAPGLNAPRLIGRVDGDFQLGARVTVGFESTFDAGVLLLYADARAWAKLCFELSPDRQPMVVSVVTRGVSDDANAFTVAGEAVRLRISRLGPSYAFHASTNGRRWELVRHFALDGESELGFLAQSPTGDGCTVTFEEIRLVPERLADLRDGS